MVYSAKEIPHTSKDEGPFSSSHVVSLLLGVLNERFNGRIRLNDGSSVKADISFQDGLISHFVSPRFDEVLWKLMAEALSSERLNFVREYSTSRGLSPLASVQQLVLIPADKVRGIFQTAVTRELVRICSAEGDLPYGSEVEPSDSGAEETLHLVEPLALMSELLLFSGEIHRFKKWLTTLSHKRFAPSGRLANVGYRSSAEVEGVVSALRMKAESFESLSEQSLLKDDVLVSVFSTLIATRSVASTSRAQVGNAQTLPAKRTSAPPPLRDEEIAPAPPGFSPKPLSSRAPTMHAARKAKSSSGVRRMSTARPAPVAPQEERPQLASSSVSPSGGSLPASRVPMSQDQAEANALKAWLSAAEDLEKRPRALAFAKKAVQHFPRSSAIQYYLGCIEILSGELVDAERTLLRVLSLEPEHQEAAHELRRLKAAVASKRPLSLRARMKS